MLCAAAHLCLCIRRHSSRRRRTTTTLRRCRCRRRCPTPPMWFQPRRAPPRRAPRCRASRCCRCPSHEPVRRRTWSGRRRHRTRSRRFAGGKARPEDRPPDRPAPPDEARQAGVLRQARHARVFRPLRRGRRGCALARGPHRRGRHPRAQRHGLHLPRVLPPPAAQRRCRRRGRSAVLPLPVAGRHRVRRPAVRPLRRLRLHRGGAAIRRRVPGALHAGGVALVRARNRVPHVAQQRGLGRGGRGGERAAADLLPQPGVCVPAVAVGEAPGGGLPPLHRRRRRAGPRRAPLPHGAPLVSRPAADCSAPGHSPPSRPAAGLPNRICAAHILPGMHLRVGGAGGGAGAWPARLLPIVFVPST